MSQVEYPVHGVTSVGGFYAKDKEDLQQLVEWLGTQWENAAQEIKDLYPTEFPEKVHLVELKQSEIDKLHLLLGHVANSGLYEVDERIAHLVTENLYEKYDLVEFNVNSDDGLTLEVNI